MASPDRNKLLASIRGLGKQWPDSHADSKDAFADTDDVFLSMDTPSPSPQRKNKTRSQHKQSIALDDKPYTSVVLEGPAYSPEEIEKLVDLLEEYKQMNDVYEAAILDMREQLDHWENQGNEFYLQQEQLEKQKKKTKMYDAITSNEELITHLQSLEDSLILLDAELAQTQEALVAKDADCQELQRTLEFMARKEEARLVDRDEREAHAVEKSKEKSKERIVQLHAENDELAEELERVMMERDDLQITVEDQKSLISKLEGRIRDMETTHAAKPQQQHERVGSEIPSLLMPLPSSPTNFDNRVPSPKVRQKARLVNTVKKKGTPFSLRTSWEKDKDEERERERERDGNAEEKDKERDDGVTIAGFEAIADDATGAGDKDTEGSEAAVMSRQDWLSSEEWKRRDRKKSYEMLFLAMDRMKMRSNPPAKPPKPHAFAFQAVTSSGRGGDVAAVSGLDVDSRAEAKTAKTFISRHSSSTATAVDSENKDEGKYTSDDNSSPTYRYSRYNSLLHRSGGDGGDEDDEEWSDEEDEEVASSTRNAMDAKNAFYSSPKKKQGERVSVPRRLGTGGASPKAKNVSHGGTTSPSIRTELAEMRKQRVMGWVKEANAAAAATNAADDGTSGLAMTTEVERFKRLPKPFKPPPYQIKKELLQHKHDS